MRARGQKQAVFKGIRAGLGLCFLAGLLAACSSGGVRNDVLWDDLLETSLRSFDDTPPPQAPDLTPELIAGFEQPLMRSTRLLAQTSGTQFGASVQRRDGVEQITWVGAGAVTFATRGGLLVGVRGSNDDLMWADVAGTLRALSAGGGDSTRSYMFLQGNVAPFPVALSCSVRPLGSEVLEIVGTRRPTRVFEEVCSGAALGPEGQIRNLYWRDTGGPTLWQSVQWAGFDTGYLRFERIIR